MDSTLIEIFGRSCALYIYDPTARNGTMSHHGVFGCVDHGSLSDSPFGDAYVISLGFVVVLCVTIPIGFFNLHDNIWLQVR